MDKKVVVRFFEIDGDTGIVPPIPEGLRRMMGLSAEDRQVEVDEGVILRLEHLEEHGSCLLGDITRVQERNLPGHVTRLGVDNLPVERIGHPTAFIYDADIKVLAIQYDIRTGVSRVCKYLRHVAGGTDVGYLPFMKRDTAERFAGQTPTTLELNISRMRDFRNVRTSGEDVEDIIEDLATMYDGTSIKLIISAREGLDGATVWNTIRRFIGYRDDTTAIKTIRSNTLESEFPFDFIRDLLKEEGNLDLPDRDTEANRRMRLDFVRACYAQHHGYITRSVNA